jgi:hypothetical protein
MVDRREAEWSATIDQLVALGMAMEFDAEALLHGLAVSTARLLSFVLVQGYGSPAEIDATLRAYSDRLREHTLAMIHHNDTGR